MRAVTTVADFEQMWRATALGGFIVGREAAKRMLPRASGTILFAGATASIKVDRVEKNRIRG